MLRRFRGLFLYSSSACLCLLLILVTIGCRTRNWEQRAGANLATSDDRFAGLALVPDLMQTFEEGQSAIFRCHLNKPTQDERTDFVALEFIEVTSHSETSQDSKQVRVKIMQTTTSENAPSDSQLYTSVGDFSSSTDGTSFTLNLPGGGMLTARQRLQEATEGAIETIIAGADLPNHISNQVMLCHW